MIKKTTLLLTLICSLLIIAGCSRKPIQQEEVEIIEEIIQETGDLQIFSGRTLSGDYTVEAVSGDQTTTYS